MTDTDPEPTDGGAHGATSAARAAGSATPAPAGATSVAATSTGSPGSAGAGASSAGATGTATTIPLPPEGPARIPPSAEVTAAGAGHDGLEHVTSTGISNEKLGMWVFLGSECLLFGGLISTYLLYKTTAKSGPLPADLYDIPFTSISSFVLLMSSLTMVLAVAAAARGDQPKLRTWLLTTALLGGMFIAGQVYEFRTFLKEGMGFTTSPASSAFFALTGFHGVHVTIGIVMLVSAFMLSLRGRIPPDKAEAIEIVGLYWHFVDVVWILIFTVIYLVPT